MVAQFGLMRVRRRGNPQTRYHSRTQCCGHERDTRGAGLTVFGP